MTILCDLDGIVADLMSRWIAIYNEKHATRVTIHDLTKYHFESIAPGSLDLLRTPGMFANLSPLPGAIDGLKYLSRKNDIVIVSAPSQLPDSASDKMHWCREHLPFVKKHSIILASQKELVRGDMLLDDSPDQLKNWALANPGGWTATISYPYNMDVPVHVRAESYRDTAAAWRTLCDRIGGRAG